MEDYLQYMRSLRYHMNDVEDQAAKISAEEQTLLTTIQTLQRDLVSEKAEAKRLEDDIELMVKAKGQLCLQIIERQRKIALLESDSSTLAQTLELLQQEKAAMSSKLAEKRSYYDKVSKDIAAKLQNRKEWVDSRCHGLKIESHSLSIEAITNWGSKLESAEAELNKLRQQRSELHLSNNKIKESIERAMSTINSFVPEIRNMDMNTLEEEWKALLSDRAQESEYLSAMRTQFQKIKACQKW